jgi:hypothetical protein
MDHDQTRPAPAPRPFTRAAQRWRKLLRAALSATAAGLRQAGLLREHRDWKRRAEICERCPMRVVVDNVSYCGPPLLEQIDRDPTLHGCGCPTLHKARTPGEHCPVDWSYRAPTREGASCTCKWCWIVGSDKRTQ